MIKRAVLIVYGLFFVLMNSRSIYFIDIGEGASNSKRPSWKCLHIEIRLIYISRA